MNGFFDGIGVLNFFFVALTGVCLVAGPTVSGSQQSGRYHRSRKGVTALHTTCRVALAFGLLMSLFGLFPDPVTTVPGVLPAHEETPVEENHTAAVKTEQKIEERPPVVLGTENIQVREII